MFDPFHWYRRRQRLRRAAREEIQFLQRRYGASALAAAQEKLNRPDLNEWGRSVLAQAIKEMSKRPAAAAETA